MTHETKTWALIVALFVAILVLFHSRKKVTTQVAVEMRDSQGNLLQAYTGELRDEMNNALQRICSYSGSSFEWPSLTQACPPLFNGQPLLSDNTSQKI